MASKVFTLIYIRLVKRERKHRKEHALLNPFVLDVKLITSAYIPLDKISHVTTPCLLTGELFRCSLEGKAQGLMSYFSRKFYQFFFFF